MPVEVSDPPKDGTDENITKESNDVPSTVTVVPPPDVRDVIERTVGYIVRSGTAFIQRLQEQRDGKFSFLFEGDPYYTYYEWRLNENKSGRGFGVGTNESATSTATELPAPKLAGPVKPPAYEFSHIMTPISAQDLEIIKTTAFYSVVKGKQFLTALSHQEGSNVQFAFLKQGHSLNPMFKAFAEEYKKIINFRPDQPSALKDRIDAGAKNKYDALTRARITAEYQAHQAEQEKLQAAEAEKEQVEYAQIDWHDFVVVETVQFSQADLDIELPRPLNISQLQFASLEERKRGIYRLEEAPPDFEPHSEFSNAHTTSIATQEENAEPAVSVTKAPEASTAKLPGKIRSAGTSRLSKLRNNQEKLIKSPFTGQMVEESKFEDHKRAMLLDPKWKEQRAVEEQRQASTNLSTAEVEQNLKRMLKRGNSEDPEEQDRKKRAATEAQWDGHYKTREEAKRKAKESFKEQRKLHDKEVGKQKNIGAERS